MGLRYLKGIYNQQQVLSTRPRGFEFPVGLNITSPLSSGNSANSGTTQTYDLLMSGGGGGGGYGNGYPESPFRGGGGGGAGGIRIVSANNWNDFTEFKNPLFIDQTTNFIPVIVGSGGGNQSPGGLTCIGTTNIVSGGGAGGAGNSPGSSGASGGGAGASDQPTAGRTGGCGCFGQGCNGGPTGSAPPSSPSGGGTGGSACANASTSGITSSITGTAVSYSGGGAYTGGNPGTNATANRGNGGGGGGAAGYGPHNGGNGGSGIVAIRYRNPAAPTTPLASGGTVCCTGDCIIHVFTSSGFLNVATTFAIN